MKNGKVGLIAASVAAACLWSGGTVARAQEATERSADQQAGTASTAVDAQGGVSAWPKTTRIAALALIEKYGQPDESSDKMLAWNDKYEWERVAVCRESKSGRGVSADFIENTVRYKVPADQVASLSRFDPSLSFDKGNNLLSARSGSEESNILALNLADEIVTGKRDVASAKELQRKARVLSMAGKSSPYSRRLLFTPEPKMGSDEAKSDSTSDSTPVDQGVQRATQAEQSQPRPVPDDSRQQAPENR